MTDPDEPRVSLAELETCRKEHVRELKRLEKMTDEQFQAFKKNFALGKLDPSLDRRAAIELLRSMICTNVTLQQERRNESSVENSADECYSDDSGRE